MDIVQQNIFNIAYTSRLLHWSKIICSIYGKILFCVDFRFLNSIHSMLGDYSQLFLLVLKYLCLLLILSFPLYLFIYQYLFIY